MRAGASLESLIRAQAFGLGFDQAGITSLGVAETAGDFERWLDAGHGADMEYLARGREKRRDTRLPFEGASSAVVVAMNYGGGQSTGSVARYARGRDYHNVMGKKLIALHRRVEEFTGFPVAGKGYVDTGPVLERDLARRAGLGWFGRNSLLISPTQGSFFFIGALFLALDLRADEPFRSSHCGSCHRCIDACPTDAIVDDGVVDSRRCISYLTIENRNAIPRALRAPMGDLNYGCDICQDVCPWNVKFARDADPSFLPDVAVEDVFTDLGKLLLLDEGEYAALFSGSPIKRAKRRGLARNVAVAMGNRARAEDADALIVALQSDPDAMVRGHAAWALGRFRDETTLRALRAASDEEQDDCTREEIRISLAAREREQSPHL